MGNWEKMWNTSTEKFSLKEINWIKKFIFHLQTLVSFFFIVLVLKSYRDCAWIVLLTLNHWLFIIVGNLHVRKSLSWLTKGWWYYLGVYVWIMLFLSEHLAPFFTKTVSILSVLWMKINRTKCKYHVWKDYNKGKIC